MINQPLTIIPELLEGGHIGEVNETDLIRASFCYMHGQLQTMVGFDIFSLLRSELLPVYIKDDKWLSQDFPTGVYEATCMGKTCTFFLWKTEWRMHGLVVLNGDLEAMHYAKQCYLTKVDSI